NPGKFIGRPKLPKYRNKGGKSMVIVDNQTAKLRSNGIVEIPVINNLKIKLQHQDTTKIQQVRIISKNNQFVVEIVYKTKKVIDYIYDIGRYIKIYLDLTITFTYDITLI